MMSMKKSWEKYLSSKRIGDVHGRDFDSNRTEFQRDKDAIIFSESFRQLRRKTQVFSMTRNDYVRDRLTHSLEVASVGRRLASMVAPDIIQRHNVTSVSRDDFESIIEAACLAHDIGHPPLAHSGEEAIKEFFAKNAERFSDIGDRYNDFLKYEGNAQNFRILCELEQPSKMGGLRLTSAVLGAITKYPRVSYGLEEGKKWNCKKHNFMACDLNILNDLVSVLGLTPTENKNEYSRSPLVYLVEAADDICYALVDIEDAFAMKEIDFNKAVELLSVLTDHTIEREQYDKTEYIQRLRAKGIGRLLNEVAKVFLDNEESLVAGTFKGDLLDYVSVTEDFNKLKQYARENIYSAESAIEVRAAGYNIIDSLLDIMVDAALGHINDNDDEPTSKQQIMLKFIPEKYKKRFLETKDRYDCLVGVTDFISSLTDNKAIDLYKRLLGASIATI